MQIVKSREYRTGFRVESWDIERLVQHLGGDEGVTRVAVQLGDGSSLTVPHTGALAGIPNPPSRPITTVCLESAPPAFLASAESPSRLAIVQLRDRGSFGLSYHVSGDERTVRDLTEKIEDWVESVTPWFGRLAFMDPPGLLLRGGLALGGMAGLTFGSYAALQGIFPAPVINAPGSFAVGARLLAIGCTIVLAAGTLWVCVRPRSLFPMAQIRLGEGADRCGRSDRLRRMVLRWSGALAGAAVTGSMLAGLLR